MANQLKELNLKLLLEKRVQAKVFFATNKHREALISNCVIAAIFGNKTMYFDFSATPLAVGVNISR